MTTQESNATNGKSKPDLIAKTKEQHGKHATFDTVGVAWTREDGSIYFKPYGRQVIDRPIYLFPATGALL